jgi:hypothetical protein
VPSKAIVDLQTGNVETLGVHTCAQVEKIAQAQSQPNAANGASSDLSRSTHPTQTQTTNPRQDPPDDTFLETSLS